MDVCHKSENESSSEGISLKLQEGESVLRKGVVDIVVAVDAVGWCIPEEQEE